MKKKVGFMCTAFRDGIESAYGPGVLTRDFLPVVEAARDAGMEYFEVVGGARFHSLYSASNEDAFDMLDAFRQTLGTEATLQSLAAGIQIVGTESQPRDVIKLHAELFRKHGITTVRNFDPLNDVDNLIYSGQCIAEAGLRHQVCVTMMGLPPGWEGPQDAESYLQVLRRILDADLPFDSVCFKDASGTAVPSTVYATIKGARKTLPAGTRIHFHTHDTAGIGVAANIAALEADADTIDLSLAPCSGGAGQPDLLVMWHNLQGTEYGLDIDVHKVREVEAFFRECMKEYPLPPESMAVDPMVIWSLIPGAELAGKVSLLRDMELLSQYDPLARAMGEVVERGGCGSAAAAVAEAYFQQALNNVTLGPWKKIAEPYGRMVLGYLGRSPVPPDPEVAAAAARQLRLQPAERAPLERNDDDPERGIQAARQLLDRNGLEPTDENIFIVATCGERGLAFLKGEVVASPGRPPGQAPTENAEQDRAAAAPSLQDGSVGAPLAAGAPGRYTVTVNGKGYVVALEGGKVTVNGKAYQVDVRQGEAAPGDAQPQPVDQGPPDSATGTPVFAQMPGTVSRIIAQVGDHVAAGETILTVEAMKMETLLSSPVDGTLKDIPVAVGDTVNTGDILAVVER